MIGDFDNVVFLTANHTPPVRANTFSLIYDDIKFCNAMLRLIKDNPFPHPFILSHTSSLVICRKYHSWVLAALTYWVVIELFLAPASLFLE